VRQIASFAVEFLVGMLAKSRLIVLVTVVAILALIWADGHVKGF
jgi:hypothetical protein